MDFKESDLFKPVCDYFVSHGYDVQAEVNSCDLVANKNGETVIAELFSNSFDCVRWTHYQQSAEQITAF